MAALKMWGPPMVKARYKAAKPKKKVGKVVKSRRRKKITLPGMDKTGVSDLRHEAFVNRMVEGQSLRETCNVLGYHETYGSELLKNPVIQDKLRERQAILADKSNVTAARVVQELGVLAFSDIKDAMPPEGVRMSPEFIRNLPRHVTRSIQSVTFKPTRNGEAWSIKMYDKQVAISRVMAMLGLGGELPDIDVLLNHLPPEIRSRLESLMCGFAHMQQGRVLPGVKVIPNGEVHEGHQVPPSTEPRAASPNGENVEGVDGSHTP